MCRPRRPAWGFKAPSVCGTVTAVLRGNNCAHPEGLEGVLPASAGDPVLVKRLLDLGLFYCCNPGWTPVPYLRRVYFQITVFFHWRLGGIFY